MYILCQELSCKHKNFGRVAIKLEQLDALLESLKTYWSYDNNKNVFYRNQTFLSPPTRDKHPAEYEL